MSKQRKTIEVSHVLQKANTYLRVTPPECVEGRKAIANLVESVLMETGNYEGFGYTKSNFDRGTIYRSSESIRYADTHDESRRQYYANEITRSI